MYEIELSINFIIALSSILLFLIIIVFIVNAKKQKIKSIEKRYYKIYEEAIVNYINNNTISEEENIKGIAAAFKNECKNKYKREVIQNLLQKLNSSFYGEISLKIRYLYEQSGLIDYSFRSLHHKKYYIKIKGIKELTHMQVAEAQDEFLRLLKYPKKEVREAAQQSIVTMLGFKGLGFLDNLECQISVWQQIHLLNALEQHQDINNLAIENWLKSNNISVVSFALKLTRIYKRSGFNKQLICLLEHSDEKLRLETIETLGSLKNKALAKTLIGIFNNVKLKEKIYIIKAVALISNDKNEPFLQQCVMHKNADISYNAKRSIQKLSLDEEPIASP